MQKCRRKRARDAQVQALSGWFDEMVQAKSLREEGERAERWKQENAKREMEADAVSRKMEEEEARLREAMEQEIHKERERLGAERTAMHEQGLEREQARRDMLLGRLSSVSPCHLACILGPVYVICIPSYVWSRNVWVFERGGFRV